MGTYVNPGNEGFTAIRRGEYVDKSPLLGTFDATLEGPDRLVMVSRPRRFGKSFAAQMVVAFYSRGCDSRALFEDLGIASHPGWDAHLNAYNVILLDMTELIQAAGVADVVDEAARAILPGLRALLPSAGKAGKGHGIELKSAILDVVRATGRKFVFVIDEWDAPYRLAQADRASQDAYAEWLRALFKGGNFTAEAVAGPTSRGSSPSRSTRTSPRSRTFRSTRWCARVPMRPMSASPSARSRGSARATGSTLPTCGAGTTATTFLRSSLGRTARATCPPTRPTR